MVKQEARELAPSDIEPLSRLEIFEPSDVCSYGLGKSGLPTPEEIGVAFNTAEGLFTEVRAQLVKGHFQLLDFMMQRLKGLFTSIGCHRLSYIFERAQSNTSKNRQAYLAGLLDLAKSEVEKARVQIEEYIANETAPVSF